MTARTTWGRVRRVWAIVGSAAGVIFLAWSGIAYRATAGAHAALQGDARVAVARETDYWRFQPTAPGDVGLLLFPGALVDPIAYAPIARAVAAGGHTALLVELPRRGAFGGAVGPELPARYTRVMRSIEARGGPRRWVVAGHSLGGRVTAELVRSISAGIAGVVLIGTSHPRDFSLATLKIPVTRVLGTRDTVADLHKLEATRHNLPPQTRWVRIDGGNHSQFGSYGFQPGDWPATISRDEQQRITVQAILDTLRLAGRKE